MRSPSDNLLQLLTDLQLCNRQDISACEKDVNRLCQDLPDFDSVWLDTLVQHSRLTRWQADRLQSPQARSIRVDEFIRSDALGAQTYLAYSSVTQQPAVLQHLSTTTPAHSSDFANRLFNLLEGLDDARETAPQSIVLPKRVVDASLQQTPSVSCSHTNAATSAADVEQYFFASEYIAGWTAEQLLIRGGRIPWPVVSEIARRLLEAQCWMEENEFVHGDIRLRNIRLCHNGRVALVAPFAARLARPSVSFTDHLRLCDAENLAPELVGTGATADSRSDLYSLGCTLWQMLTARPPFLAADPVNRILKSQEKDLPDVQRIVPDCPDWLARLIHNLSRRTPELRTQSASDALNILKRETPRQQQHVRRLLKRMPERRLRQTKASARPSSRKRSVVAAVLACLVVAALVSYGSQMGLVPRTLTVSGRTAVPQTDTIAHGAIGHLPNAPLPPGADSRGGLLVMPKPDSAGVVVLESNRTYEAAYLEFNGVVHVETSGDAGAIVLIKPGESWRISASQVVINNIQTQHERSASDQAQPPTRGLWCTTDVLTVTDCILSSASSSTLNSSLFYQPGTGTTSVVSISNSVLDSCGYGIWTAQPPQRCQLNNVLLRTQNVGMRCDITTTNQTELRIHASHVTQPAGRGFLDVVMDQTVPNELRIELVCGESVLAPSASLVRLAGPRSWARDSVRVEFLLPERGNPTIVPPNVHPATSLDRSLKAMVALSDDQLNIESLLMAVPEFRTSASTETSQNDLRQFELIDYEGPKLSTKLPGTVVSRLPLIVNDSVE